MQIGRSSLSFELPLSFEQAAAYRKANGQYVRKNQWRDTTVRVLIKENVISVSLEIVVRLFFYPFRTFEMYFAFIYDEVKKGIISV